MAVFDADSPPALTFMRVLGRAGVPVHVYSHSRLPAARLSRFARTFRRCPDTRDYARFGDWLRREVRADRIGLVAPTSDVVAFHLSEIATEATDFMRRAMPEAEAARDVLFKDRFEATCVRLGVATPRTMAPRSLDEVRDAAGSFRYPVVVKPRSHVGFEDVRGGIASGPEQLIATYGSFEASPRAARVLERHPELRLPIVQEYVPGAAANLYSVSGFLAEDGSCLAALASRKGAPWPSLLGVGTIFEPCRDLELVSFGVDIARRILGRGLFELELIREPGGRLLAIDLNARAYGQIRFDVARGSNTPLLWYRTVTRRTPEPNGPDDPDLLWLNAIPYHVGQLVGLLRGPHRRARLRTYSRSLAHRHVDIVHDAGDPLASLLFDLRMLRHPGGLVRPFLQAPRV